MFKYKRIRTIIFLLVVIAYCFIALGATPVIRPEVINLHMLNALEVEPGDTQQLNPSYVYSDNEASQEDMERARKSIILSWTSSDDSVAIVDENGLVTAVGAGTADITVWGGADYLSSSCSVKVIVRASGVYAPADMSLIVNLEGSKNLDAAPVPKDATDVKLVYASSDEAVATVDQTGTVTAVGSGECVITTSLVSLEDPDLYDFSAETVVTVQTAPESLSIEGGTLTIGNTTKLDVTTAPEKVDIGTDFTWHTSDAGIVSVNEDGKIEGKALGTATITVTNELGQSASCSITVKPIICDYCGAEGHTKSYCAKRSVANGAAGRWKIPGVGVNVACYYSTSQSVCDARDSACYFEYGSQMVIADHVNQGFNAIKSCSVGTVAYMDTGNGMQKYVCTGIIKGHNTGPQLTDADYNDIWSMNPGGITCYTCNDCWQNITIVFFQPA